MKGKGKMAAKKTSTVKSARASAGSVAPAPVTAPLAEDRALPQAETSAPVASERRPISDEERRRLIEIAAYHKAERGGFGMTNPVEDWLIAEQEIDAMLLGHHSPEPLVSGMMI